MTRDELSRLGENLTDLIQVDGGDYAAITGVIHHLHCLNNIRKVIHWDYYGPLLAPDDDNNVPEMLTKGHSGNYPWLPFLLLQRVPRMGGLIN